MSVWDGGLGDDKGSQEEQRWGHCAIKMGNMLPKMEGHPHLKSRKSSQSYLLPQASQWIQTPSPEALRRQQ